MSLLDGLEVNSFMQFVTKALQVIRAALAGHYHKRQRVTAFSIIITILTPAFSGQSYDRNYKARMRILTHLSLLSTRINYFAARSKVDLTKG